MPERIPRVDVPLSPLTTLGVGGSARWFVAARSADDVLAAHLWAVERAVPLVVLGGGSNLVVADDGFDGLVLQADCRGCQLRTEHEELLVEVGAGEPWDGVVERVVTAGFAGLECLSGIPGTAGGTPVQNVGAYGQDVSGAIESVVAVDRTTHAVVRLPSSECGFEYRRSRFRYRDAGRFIITRVNLRLRSRLPSVTYPDVVEHLEGVGISQPSLLDVRSAVLAVRRRKGMVLDAHDPDTRSVGSFFMNPVVSAARLEVLERSGSAGGHVPRYPTSSGFVKVPAAWLIERSGFGKGHAAGRVGLSRKHPLAVVTHEGATARDVIDFAALIKRRVIDAFGIWLQIEPVCVGFDSDETVAFLQEVKDSDRT